MVAPATFTRAPPTNHVSLVIERAMREEGVSAGELARRLDVDARVVQRLTNPFYFGHSTRTLRAVAAALGKHLRVTFDCGHRVW